MSTLPGFPIPDFRDPATWGPNVPSDVQDLERMSLAGNSLAAVLYGMTSILFFQCMGSLWKNHPFLFRPLAIYVVISFVLCTLFTAFKMHLVTLAFIDNSNFPGSPGLFPPGPHGYMLYSYSNWTTIVPNACFIISNWMADGLLMFRCYILCDRRILVLVLPVLMFCASLAMGVVTLYKTSRPDLSFFSGICIGFALPYFIISVTLNISLTFMMSIRIAYHLKEMDKEGYNSSNSSSYSNVITILVESCALYAVNSILFISTYGAGSGAANIFLPLLSQTQVIAPYLIILRVATDRSVTHAVITTRQLPSPTPGFMKTAGSPRNSTDVTYSDAFQLPKLSANHPSSSNHSLDVMHVVDITRRQLREEPRFSSPLGRGVDS